MPFYCNQEIELPLNLKILLTQLHVFLLVLEISSLKIYHRIYTSLLLKKKIKIFLEYLGKREGQKKGN